MPGRRRRLGAAALAVSLLGACGGPWTAEDFEVANMRPSNLVPKSSPRSFVATFERHCLDRLEAPPTIGPSLLAADFVRAPDGRGARMGPGRELYVVDDRRPSVMLERSPGKTFCGVTAASRTGQTARARRAMAARPDAVPVSAAAPGPRMEAAWRLWPDGRTLVFLQRRGTPATPASLILAAVREG